MYRIVHLLILFSLFYICSCEKATNNCPSFIQNGSISDFPMDLYGINEVEVVNEELHLNVSYGGGCEDHIFKLINIISPIDGGGQTIDFLYLSHNSNNDGCFAQILEHQLCFDISEIINGGAIYFSHPDSLYNLN